MPDDDMRRHATPGILRDSAAAFESRRLRQSLFMITVTGFRFEYHRQFACVSSLVIDFPSPLPFDAGFSISQSDHAVFDVVSSFCSLTSRQTCSSTVRRFHPVCRTGRSTIHAIAASHAAAHH